MKRFFYEGAQRGTGEFLETLNRHAERMVATGGYIILDRQRGFGSPLAVAATSADAQSIVDALNAMGVRR